MTDMATYLKAAQGPRDSQPMLSFGRWSCSCQDADGIMYPLLQSKSSWSRYDNPKMDALLEEAPQHSRHRQAPRRLCQGQRDREGRRAAAAALSGLDHLRRGEELAWQPTANESMFLNRMSWQD